MILILVKCYYTVYLIRKFLVVVSVLKEVFCDLHLLCPKFLTSKIISEVTHS